MSKKEEQKKEEVVRELTIEEKINAFFDEIPEKEPIIASYSAEAGMGKTHYANTFPNPVISDTEGRAQIVMRKFDANRYKKHTTDMATIRSTISMMLQLCTDPTQRHNWTWVMDSGSDWLQFAESEYLVEAKKDKVYPTVLWSKVYDKIDQVFDNIRKLGFNAVITQQLKQEYEGEKPTGNWIPAGYKKFPYRVDIGIHLKRGVEYNGNTYYEDVIVGEVLKDCWHSPEQRKPYILDPSYDGIFRELKPYVHPGNHDKAIINILKELEEKTGIKIEDAKSNKGK